MPRCLLSDRKSHAFPAGFSLDDQNPASEGRVTSFLEGSAEGVAVNCTDSGPENGGQVVQMFKSPSSLSAGSVTGQVAHLLGPPSARRFLVTTLRNHPLDSVAQVRGLEHLHAA